MTYISCFSDFAFYFYYYFMENCHTWIIISKWQNDLHTNTSRSVWPILYGLMIKMLQYKMYPAGELAVLRQLLFFMFFFFFLCVGFGEQENKNTYLNTSTICYSARTLHDSTVNVLKFCTLKWLTKWCMQTVQTQIRLLLKEQSDQGLHCLPFN